MRVFLYMAVLFIFFSCDSDDSVSSNVVSNDFDRIYVTLQGTDKVAIVNASNLEVIEQIDVVLDMVTGDYVQKEIDIMARDGRIALIGFLGGPKAEINFGRVLRDRITISGSTLRPQTEAEKALITDNLKSEFGELFDKGELRPHIFKTFPLERAAEAHTLMETSKHMGKIVLTFD